MPVPTKGASRSTTKSKRGRGRPKKGPSPTVDTSTSKLSPLGRLLAEQAADESSQVRGSPETTLQTSPKDGTKPAAVSVPLTDGVSAAENASSDFAEPSTASQSDDDQDEGKPVNKEAVVTDKESVTGADDVNAESNQSADDREQASASEQVPTANHALVVDNTKDPKATDNNLKVSADLKPSLENVTDNSQSTERTEVQGTEEEAEKCPIGKGMEVTVTSIGRDTDETIEQDKAVNAEKEVAKPVKGRGKRALKKASEFAHHPDTDAQSQPTSDTTESKPSSAAKKRKSPHRKSAKGAKKKRGVVTVEEDSSDAYAHPQKEAVIQKEADGQKQADSQVEADTEKEATVQKQPETQKETDVQRQDETQKKDDVQRQDETQKEDHVQEETDLKKEAYTEELTKEVTHDKESAQLHEQDGNLEEKDAMKIGKAQKSTKQKDEAKSKKEEKVLDDLPPSTSEAEGMPDTSPKSPKAKAIEAIQGVVTGKRGGRKPKTKKTKEPIQEGESTGGKRGSRKAKAVEVTQEAVKETAIEKNDQSGSKRGGRKKNVGKSKKLSPVSSQENATPDVTKQPDTINTADKQTREAVNEDNVQNEVRNEPPDVLSEEDQSSQQEDYSQASTANTGDEVAETVLTESKEKSKTSKRVRKGKGKAKKEKELCEESVSKPDEQDTLEAQITNNEGDSLKGAGTQEQADTQKEAEKKEILPDKSDDESRNTGDHVSNDELKSSAAVSSQSSQNTEEESEAHSPKPTRKSSRQKKERLVKRRSPRTVNKFLKEAQAVEDTSIQKFTNGGKFDSEDTQENETEDDGVNEENATGTGETKAEGNEKSKAVKRLSLRTEAENVKQAKIDNQPEKHVSPTTVNQDTEDYSGHVVPTIDSDKKQAIKRKVNAKTGAKTEKKAKNMNESNTQASKGESNATEKQHEDTAENQPSSSALNATFTVASTNEEEKKTGVEPKASDSESTTSDRSSECGERLPIGNKYVGAHVSISRGLAKGVLEAASMGARSFGMFLKNQRSWKCKELDDKTVEKFKVAMRDNGYSHHMVVPHGGYLMNLAAPDPEIRQKSVDLFVHELEMCDSLALPIFNFHPGSTCGKMSAEEGIKLIAEGINHGIAHTKSVIVVLENMACQGFTLGGKFEELRDIIRLVNDKSRIGVCFDTCHAMAAGYDLSTENGYTTTMQAFDNIVGFRYLKAVHINDSQGPAGNRVDRHADIGKGTIGLEGFRRIMNDPRFDNIPFILETPGGDYDKQIRKLYRLCKK